MGHRTSLKLINLSNSSISSTLFKSVSSSSSFSSFSTSTSISATLVNLSSSVDSSYGTNPPPAPTSLDSSPTIRTKTPIGLSIRGDPFPSQDSINLNINSPPSSWGRGLGGKPPNPPTVTATTPDLQKEVMQHREIPHQASIPDQTNSLDARILKAAELLMKQEAKIQGQSSINSTSESPSNISQLLESFSTLANHTLPFSLPYEPTPNPSRKVPLTNARSTPSEIEQARDDGVVLVAYVDGLNAKDLDGKIMEPKISVCSGFAVEGRKHLGDKGKGKGELLITCAHTLRDCTPQDTNSSSPTSTSSSLGLVMTRTGLVYRIHSLLSSLPSSDLILLQLSDSPVQLNQDLSTSIPISEKIRTLPISPYPSPVGSELCVSSFSGWENEMAIAFGKVAAAFSNSKSESSSDEVKKKIELSEGSSINKNYNHNPEEASSEAEERVKARGRWGRARLVEYKDPFGNEAKTGTYDELQSLEFKVLIDHTENWAAENSSSSSLNGSSQIETSKKEKHPLSLPFFSTLSNFPPPGSSGGPVVETETGSVVGIVRGNKMSVLEGRRGIASPAERVFEFFALPGIKLKNRG